MRPFLIILVALVATEGIAWWWMHPTPVGLGKPVLTWAAADPIFIDRPDLYAKSAPDLRCSTGQIRSATTPDGVGVFLGFFAWDAESSTGDVLEAFRHQPEVCLGHIGLKLIEVAPRRTFVVGNETLTFDHTILRPVDGRGGLVHAFKGVWISGVSTGTSREGILGGDESSLRSIRWNAALHRFRAAHARVVQGAIQGVSSPDQAWDVFKSSILDDLEMR